MSLRIKNLNPLHFLEIKEQNVKDIRSRIALRADAEMISKTGADSASLGSSLHGLHKCGIVNWAIKTE